MKRILLLITCCMAQFGYTQVKLSPQAEISIVTIGPYQNEIYSAFGHSGIRVYDPAISMDVFFNYGVFDFEKPNFLLNFTMGLLEYRLDKARYPRMVNFYASQNRYIHEQVLNLTTGQLQRLYEFLAWNAQPENMYYNYDYFYDNCATRLRLAMEKVFADSVTFDGSYITTDYSIRDLTDLYLGYQPWGDLGIDICLGLPMDIKATPYMYMFLPDYIESAFNHATLLGNGEEVPLIKETIVRYEPKPAVTPVTFFSPLVVFSLILVGGLLITFFGYKSGRSFFGFDIFLFTLIGIIGWLLLLLWTVTDHKAAANNLNLLWAFPLHFPAALMLLSKKWTNLKIKYFRFFALWQGFVLIAWFLVPQDLHEALIPLSLLVLVRSFYIQYYLAKSMQGKKLFTGTNK